MPVDLVLPLLRRTYSREDPKTVLLILASFSAAVLRPHMWVVPAPKSVSAGERVEQNWVLVTGICMHSQ